MSAANNGSPPSGRLFHTEFGVLVEIIDMDAFLSGRGVVRCRRIEDGAFISVPVLELVPVEGLTEADEPRELFRHRGRVKKKIWRDPAEEVKRERLKRETGPSRTGLSNLTI